MYADATAGKYSFLNRKRYYATYTAEPAIQVGYTEMCFNIAEGINRGWSSGNAASWYNKGITASMNFLGITEGSSITVGNLTGTVTYGTVDNISIANYLAQPTVQYQTGAAGLTQILTQKYIQSNGWLVISNR